MPVRRKHGRCQRIRSSEQRLRYAGGLVHAGSAEATDQQVREPVGDLGRGELAAWLVPPVGPRDEAAGPCRGSAGSAPRRTPGRLR
jgi:hypothetical protein